MTRNLLLTGLTGFTATYFYFYFFDRECKEIRTTINLERARRVHCV